MKLSRACVGVIASVMIVALVTSCGAQKNPDGIPDGREAAAQVVRGGVMYDKWWKPLKRDAPKDDHPLWAKQTTNTRSGNTTWRCKECHGWDYKGVQGVYGSGSHKTGFPGVFDARGKDAAAIKAALTSGPHDLSSLGDEAVNDLVAFVRWGTVDVTPLINPEDKKILGGNTSRGGGMYSQQCSGCHGANGKKINFGDKDKPKGVGDIARENPWEFIHKVRFGQPGTKMTQGVLLGWSLEDVRDVTAFAQGL